MQGRLEERLSTGIAGLDEVMHGGLIPQRAYLVRGGPGTGKTLVGLRFMMSGVAAGESSLFITLSEPEHNIRKNAVAFGLDLDRVQFLDLSPSSDFFAKTQVYDIFAPAEVEREPITQAIIETVQRLSPCCVFVDGIAQFRYLAPDVFQYHKQVLSFVRFLVEKGATVLLASEYSQGLPDDDLQFLTDGVITLEYTPQGRFAMVSKYRGSGFEEGCHSLCVSEKGIEVFPQLVPETYHRACPMMPMASGVTALDEMLHGGLERGTVSLISGPVGAGKTTVAMQFVRAAAERGERSAIFVLDESIGSWQCRSESIGIPVRELREKGALSAIAVEPMHYSADEFASLVRREVEEYDVHVVVIDSITGYKIALQGRDLVVHLHALTRYLKNMGVTVILINEVQRITGEFSITEKNISYLADNILFLRYYETGGELHKAIGILKKRISDYEKGLYELAITGQGIVIGEQLRELHGVMRGIPDRE